MQRMQWNRQKTDDAKNAVEQTEDSTFGGTADEFEYGKFNNFAF